MLPHVITGNYRRDVLPPKYIVCIDADPAHAAKKNEPAIITSHARGLRGTK